MPQTPYRVLIVEDSLEDRVLYQRCLQKATSYQYEFQEAESGEEGLAQWQHYHPDVILLDYQLPDMDGLTFLEELKHLSRQQFLPVVMITGQGNEAIAVQAIKAGAQDYLVKEQITSEGLQRSINGAIKTAQLSTQLQQHQEREHLMTALIRQIYQSLNLDEIYQMTVNQLRAVLKTDRMLILQMQPGEKSAIVAESVGEGWLPLWTYDYTDPCLQFPYVEAFRQGLVVQHADIHDGSVNPCLVKFLEPLQVQASLAVPIRRQDHLWGLLIAHQCGSIRQWQTLEIDLLKDLTAQLGIALYQAELHQQLYSEISERKRIEQNLRQNQSQLQQQLAEIEAIYQTAPIGLGILDPDLRFVRINQRLADINGSSVEDHLDRSVRELLPDLADTAEQLLRPILETGEPRLNVEIEGETPAQPGANRNWLEHFLPLKDNEQVIGISIVCEEITEQKRIEKEREQILSRERAAREAAERANRIKDEFLAVLSHELRTPLNPILGWAKLLQVSQLNPEKVTEALASIERNAKLLNQLIEDLLDLAGILRGQLRLQIAPVDLAAVIQSALETVQPSADNKAITLQTTLSSVSLVAGDAGRLQQVIWNLLSNAIKFTPSGGQVKINLEQVDDLAQITISDTGKGISSQFLPHVFESFIQEDYSITRQYGGLGLGLAIVRQLVEAHGGAITAASQGKELGATFSVYLPLARETAASQPIMPTSTTALDLQGVRILVVDDEPDICTLLTVLLSHYGATVLTVNSAAEALEALPTFQPNFLVNDVGLPDIDGYRLMQQIRALPTQQLSQVPAIALTAYARKEDRQRALDSGYQMHLAKPIEPEQLVEAIISVLNSRS